MASILIIEDDIVDLMAIKRSLVPLNNDHNFSYASSLQEAHKIMANSSFDLIFTDYNLGDGIATEISDTSSPIVLMTGMVEMPNPDIAGQFEKILVKDIKHSHLTQIVTTIQYHFEGNVNPGTISAQTSTPLQQLSVSFGSDKSFLKDMLLELKTQLQSALIQLNQTNLAVSDPILLDTIHKVKSQFLLGGFSEGAKVSENLEQAIRKNEATEEQIQSLIASTQNRLKKAIKTIEVKLEEL